MAELIAISPTEGLLPVTHGAFTLSEATPGRITSVAPFQGKEKPLSAALKKAYKLAFPAPNRMLGGSAGRIVWSGYDQAFVLDADPAPLAGLAALTDQSDGWAGLRLAGPEPERVLARLMPIDLRPAVFAEGDAARVGLNHMMAVIWRAAVGFEILVFRSMARTAVHEIAAAMAAVAARG